MAVGYLFEDVRLGGVFPDLVGEVVQPIGLLWSSTFRYLLWATSSGGCAVVGNALAAGVTACYIGGLAGGAAT